MSRKKDKKFEQIYSDYKDTILKISYIYLKDYQLAEDAVQETFCKVLRKLSTLKDETKTKAWISRIAVNVCRDKLKHKSRREIPVECKEEENYSNENELDNKLTVTDAVFSLQKELREVVILYYYQEFTQNEIASILKLPETTIAYRIRKSKELLRDLLREDFKDD